MKPVLCRIPWGLYLPFSNGPGGGGLQQTFVKGRYRSYLEYPIFSSSPKPRRKHPSAFTGKTTSPSLATNRTRSPGGMGRGELR